MFLRRQCWRNVYLLVLHEIGQHIVHRPEHPTNMVRGLIGIEHEVRCIVERLRISFGTSLGNFLLLRDVLRVDLFLFALRWLDAPFSSRLHLQFAWYAAQCFFELLFFTVCQQPKRMHKYCASERNSAETLLVSPL